MRTTVARVAVSLAVALTSAPALADVYRYVDELGDVIYSNVPPSGIPDPDEPSGSARNRLDAARPATVARVGRAGVASPSDFPKVSASAQRDRDSLRRRILEDELRDERILHRQAEVRGASEEAEAHQRNIRSLEKELTFSSR